MKNKEEIKAILVLNEMPNECMECPLRFKDGDTDDWFRFRCHMSTDQVEKGKRLENCPLKPMPNKNDSKIPYLGNHIKMSDGEEVAYYIGWNDCIDEILGEEE